MADAQVMQKLGFAPDKPGVYIMRDQGGRVIYVGKAVSLKNRVRSYFSQGKGVGAKVRVLANQVADLEFIVTDSEVEALILECNLIKKYRPRYNVNLKDDKNYPYLKVTLQEEFPRLIVTRNMADDGARYYGPYTSAGALHDTVGLLKKAFRLRTCKDRELANRQRPCLNFHIKRCDAPCMGNISPEEYRETINEVCLFLDGRQADLVERLRRRMEAAADRLKFEEAALLRDQLEAVERVAEGQKMVSASRQDQDIIAFVRKEEEACFQIFFVRQGKVVGRDHFFLEGVGELSRPEIMAAFLKRYYDRVPFIPREILLAEETAEKGLLEEWLRGKQGGKVYLRVPKRGEKAKLVGMVEKNARLVLREIEAGRQREEERTIRALEELAAALSLPGPPERIECFDISNIQGTLAVGSMVVFTRGLPDKREYRHFRIKTVKGSDDFAMLREVLYRRFSRAMDENLDQGGFSSLPDLLIVDGGKGQLGAALEILTKLGLEEIPTFGLAKEFEELHPPWGGEPLRLPRDSAGLYLLQRIRDEAHRFAVEYHRKLRSKQLSRSLLDEIPGVGPRRKKTLLKHFGSVKAIARASLEEIASLSGMNRKVAADILALIREKGIEG